ncbi:MAG: hypothetical protein AAFR55_08210, partial [Pseudomonadota bacterium]
PATRAGTLRQTASPLPAQARAPAVAPEAQVSAAAIPRAPRAEATSGTPRSPRRAEPAPAPAHDNSALSNLRNRLRGR